MKEKTLCRLLGYLLGDASLKIKKVKGTQKIQTEAVIECADRAIVEDFANTCKALLKRDVGKLHERNRSEKWRTTYSFSCKIPKPWRKLLFSLSPTYRTKPYREGKKEVFPAAKVPAIVFGSEGNMRNFLQAFVNSEGSVQLRVNRYRKSLELMRYAKISCSHPMILDSVSDMLRRLSIENRKVPKKKPNALIIQQRESLDRFRSKINFMEGIVVSRTGIWSGFQKRDVLGLLIKTYRMKRGKLQEFENEDNVYGFLRSHLTPGDGL